LIEAIKRLMEHDSLTGPVNIGNPDEFTIKQLAETVVELVGGTARIIYRDLPADDPRQRCPDISLAQSQLGWQPVVKLRQGLQRTIDYFREKLSEKEP
jgi:UDP-glucuronate decarboxylase